VEGMYLWRAPTLLFRVANEAVQTNDNVTNNYVITAVGSPSFESNRLLLS